MKTILLTALTAAVINISFSQWQQTASTPQGAGITDMVVLNDGTLIVTTASYNWPNGQPGGIRRSTDNGNSWQNINNVYNARTLWLGSTGKIFASYWPYPNFESAYYSTNNGISWNLLLTLSGSDNIFSIASTNSDSTVFLGTRNGIRRTTNNGNSFINLINGLPANSWVRDLRISSSGIIFAATTNGVYKSTNNGNLWIAVPGMATGDTAVTLGVRTTGNDLAEGEVFVVGTSNGKLYETQDGEYTHVVLAALFNVTLEITFFGGPVQATGFDILSLIPHQFGQQGGVAQSTNGGANYTIINDGLPNPAPVGALGIKPISQSDNALLDLTVYAGLFQNQDNGAKIFKRTIPIGIQQISNEVPNGFSLSQNYPNPFNPSTRIQFSIPKPGFVKLIVYDNLGREITTLVNENLNAGTFELSWNAGAYSSGVYYYRLISSSFSETKKMILNK